MIILLCCLLTILIFLFFINIYYLLVTLVNKDYLLDTLPNCMSAEIMVPIRLVVVQLLKACMCAFW